MVQHSCASHFSSAVPGKGFSNCPPPPSPSVPESSMHWLMVYVGPTPWSASSLHLQAWKGKVCLGPQLEPRKPRLAVMQGGHCAWGRLLHPVSALSQLVPGPGVRSQRRFSSTSARRQPTVGGEPHELIAIIQLNVGTCKMQGSPEEMRLHGP